MRVVSAWFFLLQTRAIFEVRAKFVSVTEAAAGSSVDSTLETAGQGECRVGDETCRGLGNAQPSLNQKFGDRSLVDEECSDAKMEQCVKLVSRYPSREEACIELFDTMQIDCRKTCNFCGGNTKDRAKNVYSEQEGQHILSELAWRYNERVDDYMYKQVFVEERFATVRNDCKNRNELCTFWSASGECDANPSYMKMQCAPACFSCDQLSFETRCPYDPKEPAVWSKPGDLERMFTRIVTDPQFVPYNPQIMSQPQPSSKDIFKGPWVVVLDNFLTPEECKTLQELGASKGFERSKDVGERKFDGSFDAHLSDGRTSTNAWCTEDCWDNPMTKAVHNRIENLIQIPSGNYEHLQILQYEKGQFYEIHHDYIEHHLDRRPGPRILTVFLYLNDVEAGGGTNFPLLNNMTVYPKQGRVLVWPSVLDEDPMKKDRRTEHQALPVEKGVKYGTNAWVHQRDFKEVWEKGCH